MIFNDKVNHFIHTGIADFNDIDLNDDNFENEDDDELEICEESTIQKMENEKFNNMTLRNNFFKEQILKNSYEDNDPCLYDDYDNNYRYKIQSYINVYFLNKDIKEENEITLRTSSILYIYNYLKSLVDNNPKKEIDIMYQLDNLFNLQTKIIEEEVDIYLKQKKENERIQRREELLKQIMNPKELDVVHNKKTNNLKKNNKNDIKDKRKNYKSALLFKKKSILNQLKDSIEVLNKTCIEFIKNEYIKNNYIDVDPKKFDQAIREHVLHKIKRYSPEEIETLNNIMTVMFDNLSKDESSRYFLPKRQCKGIISYVNLSALPKRIKRRIDKNDEIIEELEKKISKKNLTNDNVIKIEDHIKFTINNERENNNNIINNIDNDNIKEVNINNEMESKITNNNDDNNSNDDNNNKKKKNDNNKNNNNNDNVIVIDKTTKNKEMNDNNDGIYDMDIVLENNNNDDNNNKVKQVINIDTNVVENHTTTTADNKLKSSLTPHEILITKKDNNTQPFQYKDVDINKKKFIESIFKNKNQDYTDTTITFEIPFIDFYRLKDVAWICGILIHKFGDILEKKFESNYYFSLDLMDRLYIGNLTDKKYNYENVRRWNKLATQKSSAKINILEKKMLFFPINFPTNYHFFLIVVNIQQKAMFYFNSLFQEREISLTFTNVIKKYLNDEADHFKMDFNCDNFSVFNMDDYSGPKQQDGYNCGVYTMMLMDFISHGYDYRLVEHSRMSHFRSYIAISLKQGTKNIN